MRIIVDMSLSPDWTAALNGAGFEAQHWSEVGKARAADTEIMQWARQHNAIVFTHDLDFGTVLALTHADGPSVIQIRTEDVAPDAAGSSVIGALRSFADELAQGALVVIDEARQRVRVLPLQR